MSLPGARQISGYRLQCPRDLLLEDLGSNPLISGDDVDKHVLTGKAGKNFWMEERKIGRAFEALRML
jgi:hypothetical protein